MPGTYYTEFTQLHSRVQNIAGIIPEDLSKETALKIGANAGLSLDQMHKNAIDNIENLLWLLGYDSRNGNWAECLAELNEKIQEFHATTMNLNGENLQTLVLDPLGGQIMDRMQQEYWAFRSFLLTEQDVLANAFIQLVEQQAETALPDIANDLAADLGLDLYHALNNIVFDFTKGTVTGALGSIKTVGGKLIKRQYLDNIVAAIRSGQIDSAVADIKNLMKSSPEFSRRLAALAVQKKIITSDQIFSSINGPTFGISASGDGMMIYYDIIEPFMPYLQATDAKGTKAEKAAVNYLEELKRNNSTEYENVITQLVGNTKKFMSQFFDTSNLTPQRANELSQHFNQAIEDIVRSYPAALFTGRNTNAITGLLGEIQGLYYMYSIMGDNGVNLDVSWIGGNTKFNDGVKSGADLIIDLAQQRGYGIQIKNSTNLTDATNLSSFAFNEDYEDQGFLKQLSSFGIPIEIIKAIEDVLIMPSFNISYRFQGRYAAAGDPKGPWASMYLTTYDEIVDLAERARRYLALAAALIARVQYLKQQNFTESNTLWLIGGSMLVSAAQILEQLINQIENKADRIAFQSRLSSTFEDNGKATGFTIVQYINGKGFPTSLKTVLHTSYNFHVH